MAYSFSFSTEPKVEKSSFQQISSQCSTKDGRNLIQRMMALRIFRPYLTVFGISQDLVDILQPRVECYHLSKINSQRCWKEIPEEKGNKKRWYTSRDQQAWRFSSHKPMCARVICQPGQKVLTRPTSPSKVLNDIVSLFIIMFHIVSS